MMALTTGKFFMYSKDMDTVKAFDSKEAACTYIVRSGCETFHAISEVEAISIMLDECKTAERSLLSRYDLSNADMDALCAINNMETLDDLYQAYLMVN